MLLLLPVPAWSTTIGIIGFQFSTQTQARVSNAAATAARARGWDVILLDSEGSLPKHVEQLDQLVARKVDGIIVAMGKPVEAEAGFHNARAHGIPVITVESGVNPNAVMDISSDDWTIGIKMTQELLGYLGFNGNILSSRYENSMATRVRGKMLDAVLSENTSVRQIGTYTMVNAGAWRDDVRSGMEALLLQNQGRVRGIWAAFDGQAFVIDDLLQAQGLTRRDIAIVSGDGSEETYRRIADPDSCIVATVAVPFERMAVMAVDAIDRIAVQKQPATGVAASSMDVSPVLVDAGNVKEFLR